MKPNAAPKLATVFGASGFLGRHIVRVLAARGYRVRAVCRRPDLAGHLQPLGNVGQISAVQANLRHRWSIDRAVAGSDVVINVVGLLAESGKQKFDTVQARGAGWIADAAVNVGAKVVHISAIGADENSVAEYAVTKAEGERLVYEACPDAIVLRPSVVFGPEDSFFNRFAAMARIAPALPMIGGGHTKLQPVYVGDVAQAVARAADGELKPGSIWELGGAQVMSFRECMELMLSVIGRSRLMANLPFGLARLIGSVLEYLPGAPLTAGQVDLLRVDNVVSKEAEAEGRTLAGMGITPTPMGAILPQYMVRFRKHGQFEAKRGL